MSPANKKKNKNNNPGSSNQNNTHDHNKAEIMFPSFHTSVLDSLAGSVTPLPWFQHQNTVHQTDDHATNIMGTFLCTNPSCPQQNWGSKKIAILIRRYKPGNGYNAVVYSQRCRSCKNLGRLNVGSCQESYVDRVTYRLKKWAGVPVERPVWNGKRGGPEHERALCEGCKRGVCVWDK